jgi:hypothetical protein
LHAASDVVPSSATATAGQLMILLAHEPGCSFTSDFDDDDDDEDDVDNAVSSLVAFAAAAVARRKANVAAQNRVERRLSN